MSLVDRMLSAAPPEFLQALAARRARTGQGSFDALVFVIDEAFLLEGKIEDVGEWCCTVSDGVVCCHAREDGGDTCARHEGSDVASAESEAAREALSNAGLRLAFARKEDEGIPLDEVLGGLVPGGLWTLVLSQLSRVRAESFVAADHLDFGSESQEVRTRWTKLLFTIVQANYVEQASFQLGKPVDMERLVADLQRDAAGPGQAASEGAFGAEVDSLSLAQLAAVQGFFAAAATPTAGSPPV